MNRKGITLLAWILILLIGVPSLVALLNVISHIPDRDIQRGAVKMGLIYQDTKQVHSQVQVATASDSLVDDPQAGLTFNLEAQQVVLIIYQATTHYGTASSAYGIRLGINIDGSDVARIATSATRIQGSGGLVVWLGQLAAGPHTIKGRFMRDAPTLTVRIDERRLTAIIFAGAVADFAYIRSIVSVNTSSGTLVNDTEALQNLNLTEAQKALIIYNAGNFYGDTEFTSGKKIAIQVDGVDGIDQGSCNVGNDYADSETVAEIRTLGAGAHTIQGRFASNLAPNTVTIAERQLAILLFDPSLETDFVESTVQVSTTSSSFINDTEAQVSRSISGIRYVFAIYTAGKHRGITNDHGFKIAINVGGTDYTQADKGSEQPTGVSHLEAVMGALQSSVVGLTAGSRTVGGRIANDGYFMAREYFTRHQLVVLWFVPPSPPTPPSEAFEKKEEKQETVHSANPGLLHSARVRVMHRTTRLVPWVV